MEFLESFDHSVWNFLQAKRKPWLDPVLVCASYLGQPWVLLAVAACSALLFSFRRRFAEAGLVLGSCLGAFLLAWGLGILIERPRPDVMIRPQEVTPASSSFPSSETLVATATYASLCLAVRGCIRLRLRQLTPLVALLLALVVGLSRALIGVNYPSDIAAGWLAGLAWALICYLIANPTPETRNPKQGEDSEEAKPR